MRSSMTPSNYIVCQMVVGIILALGLVASPAAHAQPTEDTLKKGQTLIVRLVTISVNATTRELEALTFEEPFVGRRWRAPGCGIRMADHPYLQQALERGFLLRIQSEATSSCIRTYVIGRDENLIGAKLTPPIRTPILSVTGTGALPAFAPFTPIERWVESPLTVTGTGRLTPRALFTPVSMRTDALILTGTGSR